jgi:hypothetical protein
MNYIELFRTLRAEGFTEEVALQTCLMVCTHNGKSLKSRHMDNNNNNNNNRYLEELLDKFGTLFFETPKDIYEKAKKLWEQVHKWHVGRVMDDYKTFRELLGVSSELSTEEIIEGLEQMMVPNSPIEFDILQAARDKLRELE